MYKNRKKRTIIIGSLFAILVVMTVGYAAFSTKLKISGTSNIASKWDIKITNVAVKSIDGSAENVEGSPSYNALTASVEANLFSPGDAVTYEITIENQGDIDAVLNKITKTNSNNPDIVFEIAGLTEGSELPAHTSTTMTIKVSYSTSVTAQPDNLTSELNVTLDYGQKGTSGVLPPTTTQQLSDVISVNFYYQNDNFFVDIDSKVDTQLKIEYYGNSENSTDINSSTLETSETQNINAGQHSFGNCIPVHDEYLFAVVTDPSNQYQGNVISNTLYIYQSALCGDVVVTP